MGGSRGQTTNNVGQQSATVVWGGQPHVFYLDDTNDDLRHAWWTGSAWLFETLDGAGGPNGRTTNFLGWFATVLVWNNQPHIWYYDKTGADLRHAWWNGRAWYFETLDGAGGTNGRVNANVGEYGNSSIVWSNQPHIFYWESNVNGGGNLRHAWWSGGGWNFETLDGNGGANGRTSSAVGSYSAIAIWNNQPHVWYRDVDAGNLRHAWWNGRAWYFETLDGAGGTNGRVNADVGRFTAALIWNGAPHVWYHDITNADLRHGWWSGAQWFFETIDGSGGTTEKSSGSVGQYATAITWNGVPYVFYQDETAGDLRRAWWNGSRWVITVLDGNGGIDGRTSNSVGQPDSAIVWNRTAHVWYFDDTADDLRHGWFG